MNTCVSTSPDMDLTSFSPCSHEEADTMIFLHVDAAATSGHRNILVNSPDSDVVSQCVRKLIKHQQKIVINIYIFTPS